jgi:hypothetical protein
MTLCPFFPLCLMNFDVKNIQMLLEKVILKRESKKKRERERESERERERESERERMRE